MLAIAGCPSKTPLENAPELLPALSESDAAVATNETADASKPDIPPPVKPTPPSRVVPPTSLVDHSLWIPATAAEDPFDDRPALPFECPEEGGYQVFEGSFEVDTDFCDYMTAWQPSLKAAKAGDVIFLDFWHLDLMVPESGEPQDAHVAVQIGDDLVWEVTLPIPSPSGILEPTVLLPSAVELGTPIYFHVHNHGPNSYRLLRVETQPPKPIR